MLHGVAHANCIISCESAILRDISCKVVWASLASESEGCHAACCGCFRCLSSQSNTAGWARQRKYHCWDRSSPTQQCGRGNGNSLSSDVTCPLQHSRVGEAKRKSSSSGRQNPTQPACSSAENPLSCNQSIQYDVVGAITMRFGP